jgi:DnaJ-class molecular chaperone
LVPREKDYYSILGCSDQSTPEQIKEAYRTAVKKHHPDTSVGGAEPDTNKFRDIMEAYSVLSVFQSRMNYDLMKKKNPQDFRVISEDAFNKSHRPDKRDKSGNAPAAQPAADSYAAERRAELAVQRKQYNVNDLGFYRGGVPQPGRGPIRGSAIGPAGSFHSPATHNFLNNYH